MPEESPRKHDVGCYVPFRNRVTPDGLVRRAPDEDARSPCHLATLMLRLRDVLRAAVAHGENHEDLRLHYALPMRPQQLSAAHSEKIRISPEDRVDRTREQLRTVPRIGVGKTEYFTAYMAGADEKCPLLAEPTIGQRLRSNHAHTRIIGGETSCYLTRPIG